MINDWVLICLVEPGADLRVLSAQFYPCTPPEEAHQSRAPKDQGVSVRSLPQNVRSEHQPRHPPAHVLQSHRQPIMINPWAVGSV